MSNRLRSFEFRQSCARRAAAGQAERRHAAPWTITGLRSLCFLLFLLPSASRAETLEHLISQALGGHPALASQRAQISAAQSGTESADWQFYPTPSISVEQAGSSQTDPSYQGDGKVTVLRLQQPLWTGGRLTAGKAQAEAGLEQSRAALEEVAQQLALRVVQSYGDWLNGHLKTRVLLKSNATHIRLHAQVLRRIEQGLSADSDLVLAVTRMASVAADLSSAAAQEETALVRLGQLLGRPVSAAELEGVMANSVTSPPRANTSLQALLDQALRISPQIRKANAVVDSQTALIAQRRADLSPEVYVRLERQYGNYNIANSGPQTRMFVGLTSYLGAGLSTFSNIQGAEAQRDAAVAEVETQRRAVSEQVLADNALEASYENRMTSIKTSLGAAEQVSESWDRQFLAGRKTWLDVMNAARELAQTESQLAELESSLVVLAWRIAIYTRGVEAVLAGTP